MQSKALLIAIAAFAVTASGVYAAGNATLLLRAGLSERQIAAFETAKELREKGDSKAARDVLIQAGVNEETLVKVREAAREARRTVHQAVVNNDYASFLEATKGTPLADIITTEADFAAFRQAYEHRHAGRFTEADALFTELGLDTSKNSRHGTYHRHEQAKNRLNALSTSQQQALNIARQANDQETVQAILVEAGIERQSFR